MQSVSLLRKDLIKRLSEVKEDNIAIFNTRIDRNKLLAVLRLQTDDVITIGYGNIQWGDYDYINEHGQPRHAHLIKENGISISCNHTIMRFFDRPRMRYYNPESTAVLCFNDGIAQNGYQLDARALLEALANVIVYTASEETRPVLCCVRFEFDGDMLTLCGADGFRLLEAKLPANAKQDSFLIHHFDIAKLTKLLNRKETAHISTTDKTATFTAGDSAFTFDKQDGTYPNFKQLIPEDKGTAVQVIGSMFYDAVNPMPHSENNAIRLTITKGLNAASPGIIHLQTQDGYNDLHKTEAEVDCIAHGDCKIALNQGYLETILRQIGNNKATMFIESPSSPVKVVWDNYTAILMPMFVQWE